MKRRSFLKNIGLAGLAPLMLNGIPVNAMSNLSQMQQLAGAGNSDRVLVLIQLHGGNDGLNTLIPLDQYSKYFSLRPNIAIPESGSRKYIGLDSTLSDQQQLGLHPDMESFKALYDKGEVSIIQNVGYENTNGSHFRSTDIWFMGGSYDESFNSGWAGRYLSNLYRDFPAGYPNRNMQDPPGLEIGNSVSLAFHTGNGIPAAISVENPGSFYDLVTGVGGMPPEGVSNSPYGEELKWIMDVEQKSNQYAGRLKEVYDKGRNSASVRYPGNNLSGQLKVISRLLSGGSQTKIFLARLTGFDTHGNQTIASDPTLGTHASLLKRLFDSVKAFQDELAELGLADRVLTTTFSEFGRRAISNGSFGTDHGTAAPLFVFGKHLNPGVIGTNADLNNLEDGNLKHQFDYRQVFGTILKDWMKADISAMEGSFLSEFASEPLPIIHRHPAATATTVTNPAATAEPLPLGVTAKEQFLAGRFGLDKIYPNPASSHVNVEYHLEKSLPVRITLMNMSGQAVLERSWSAPVKGKNKARLLLSNVEDGMYLLVLEAGAHRATKQLIVKK